MAVDRESPEEQQRLFAALSAEGTVLMPLDDYGFGPCGWVGDHFGLTWQLGLAAA